MPAVVGGGRVSQWPRSLDLTTHTSLSPIRRGFTPGFVICKKECTRLAAAGDKVYQLLAHGRWFSPGTPASPTTKTGRHDIAEILLKAVLEHQKSNQSSPSVVANPETHWAQDTWQRTKTTKQRTQQRKLKSWATWTHKNSGIIRSH